MMTRTIKILTLLAVMAITAGQAWAEAPTYGKIHYTQGGTDGGRLCFSNTLGQADNYQTDFNSTGESSGNDWIDTYTVTDRTLTDGKVYVRALPSFGYTVTGMTITVEPSAPSSTAEAPRRGAPTVGSTIPVTPVEGHSGVYTFPMPTDGTNVTVTASFPVSTPIDVDYLDATGAKQTAKAYVLDGAELYLGESGQEFWYVCNSAIDYRTQLRLYGDTHIILADGKTMTVEATDNHSIEANKSLFIYGQSKGTGKLSVKVTPSNNHNAPSGIYASNTITINGGIIDVKANNATATATGEASFAIYANDEVVVNGGQVTATGYTGIKGNNITLGWTNATDFIKASSYRGTVKTASGKPYLTYTPAATANDADKPFAYIAGGHTFTADELTAIAGKKLVPNPNGLTYMDWDDTQKKLVEKNTATDENTANDIVYVLQGGGATTLPGGWYVAKGEVNYTGQLNFTGDTHLILADDAEMSFGTATNPINVTEITASNYALSIYCQDKDNGKLNGSLASTTGDITINGGVITGKEISNGNDDIVIHGGIVNVESINTEGGDDADIIITGGTITITFTETLPGAYALYASGPGSDVKISGGQVTVTGIDNSGIKSENGDIILSLTNGSDFITAKSYSVTNASGSVKIPAGKALIIDGTETILGNTNADYVFGSSEDAHNTLAGKTLRLSESIATGGAAYLDVCPTNGSFALANTTENTGVKLFAIKAINEDGSIQLSDQPVEGAADDQPLIACKVGTDGKPNGSALGNTINLIGVPETGNNGTTAESIENSVEAADPTPLFTAATDDNTKVEDLLYEAAKKAAEKAGKTVIVSELRAFQMVAGAFIPVKYTSASIAKKGKPLLTMTLMDILKILQFRQSHPSSAPRHGLYIDFGEDETMGINSLTPTLSEGEGAWYTIDGRKISGKPAQKGMYINKGRKVVIR